MIKNTSKRIDFKGGVNKVAETATMTGFSTKQNFRDCKNNRSGLVSRKGQSRQHSTTDAAQEIVTLFQHIEKGGTKNLYAQRVDGSVHKATSLPPATTTGNFGTEVLGTATGSIPASFSFLDKNLLYSDKARGHYGFPGVGQSVKGFVVYKGSAAIPVIPQIGEDYTNEVSDSSTTRVAILNSLNTLANYNTVYICTELRANSLTFTMVNVNGNTVTLSGQYWKSDGTWASLTGFSDGTAIGGVAFAQTGTITWTHPSDEIPHYQFGKTGYWYRLNVSAALDSSVSVAQVTYTGSWQAIENVWDGALVPIIEAQTYKIASLRYSVYGHNSINISGMFRDSGDYVYFASNHRLCGFYINVGNTPNIIKAAITGSTDVSFVDGGTSDDFITWQQARFDLEGFEDGQSIVITNTVSNNATRKAKLVTGNKIYTETGTLTAETNVSATLTFDNTGSNTMTCEFWDGDGWTAVSNFNDGTTVASKSGFVTFSRTATAQKTQFNESVYAYWYRFKFSKVASRFASIAISGMPYFDIADLGNGTCSTTWQGRPVYNFDKDGNFIWIGSSNRVCSLNGDDYRPFNVSDDGETNQCLAMTPFFQHLLVWQEEKGMKGGKTTIIQGYSPDTFQKYTVSGNIGIVNAKAYDVVDGIPTPSNPKASNAKMVYFISNKGFYKTDGMSVVCVSDPVGIYFDPSNANCIRKGYENKHWVKYDSMTKNILIGLCTGSSATVANTFLVFNPFVPEEQAWGTDTRGQALTCMVELEANSGNVTTLQYAGSSDGFVYQINTGLNDVGASTVSIPSQVVLEIDGNGEKIDAKTIQVRCKAQTAGTFTPSIAFNGNPSFTDEATKSMISADGNAYVFHDFSINRDVVDHIAVKLTHDTVSEEFYLYDMALINVKVKNVIKT